MSKAVKIERTFQQEADDAGERCYGSCLEELDALKQAQEADDSSAEEDARTTIQEGPLSVEVRSDWASPGSEDVSAKGGQFCILLGTGGPASRIIGDLDDYCQPKNAHFEFQDWFKPWTRANLTGEQEAVLLAWSQNFYFGD